MRKISGEYVSIKELKQLHAIHIDHITLSQIQTYTSLEQLLDKKKTDDWYEWFIVNFTDWYKLKIKLDSYVLKHTAKDDLNNMKNLINICLEDGTDDLKCLFLWDEVALKKIDETEKKVFDYYNSVVEWAEKLLLENKELFEDYKNAETDEALREARKQVAIKNNKNQYFWILMRMLEWKEVDYKEFVRGTIEV